MTYNALAELETAGIPVAALSDEQRSVVSSLTPGEVELVTKINSRLAEAGADVDVEGHLLIGGGIF
jgi:hypothetical protein